MVNSLTTNTVLNLENLFINEIFGSVTLFFLAAYAFIFWYSLKHNWSPWVAIYMCITFTGLFSLYYNEIWWAVVSVIALFITMAYKRFLGKD